MNIENQQNTTPFPETPNRHIVEYSTLVNTVQLSVARKLDVEGSFTARDFESLLTYRTDQDRENIINEVGGHFDDALIQFVVGSLTGRRNHETIILAEENEGVQGHLPWESKLLAHIALLQSNGLLPDVRLQVERYSSDYTTIEPLSDRIDATTDVSLQQNHAA